MLLRTAWWRQHAVSAWKHLSWRQRPVWPNKHLRMRRLTLRAQQPMRSVTNYYQPRNVDMSVGARCELRGVMRPWFGFFYLYRMLPHLSFFSSLFPYLPPPLLIYSLISLCFWAGCRVGRLNLALAFRVYFVLYCISVDWRLRAFVVFGLVLCQ